VTAFVPLALLAAGCSSSRPYAHGTTTPTPYTVIGTLPKAPTQSTAVPAQYRSGDATAGKKVFLTAGCTGCHTLADANSHGTVGPVLTNAHVPLSKVVHNVVHGAGAMPPFAGQLSTKQIADVAAYVVKASG
jgi:mono/diheme cytochrome c family protein